MKIPDKEITGFVLAGGMSKRFGDDKSRAVFCGKPLVVRAAETLRKICSKVYISGYSNLDGLEELSLKDVHPLPDRNDLALPGDNKASLVGLTSALLFCQTAYAAILAVDLPFVTGRVFEILFEEIGSFSASIPEDLEGRIQTLSAIYAVNDFRKTFLDSIISNQLTIHRIVHKKDIKIVGFEKFTKSGCSEHTFFNINTKSDLELAEKLSIVNL
ncbi:MAG TPA: molybdenum cofactor guanylyltransferase [Pyrinomonadaceae bacterium]|nr:molybdenum cofactor guanylyltransferase [Pyrinomonadaceae bacterium]